ncbi:MAG: D-glycero-beta-D-manno-heptose 1-phosphate adenylyltransferase, partial [bacterium]
MKTGKIIEFNEIKKEISELRKESKKIVFTNGCFDIIHAGHVGYLNKAKALGDILVVGINSDKSVKRLKGESRPVINEKDRAYILANLKPVDYVVIFDEDTPYILIKEIIPDILVKGGDYEGKNVVGRDIVESAGGRVALIDFISG